ncbi:hypothetical protein PUMCH_004322 [Australozyma saopauloensis]|uniref:THO complex subunit 2 n=1 Tax=Australozyma saopauloensis TaxID=291208 RepID=A0AAX4HEZ0_9ASCO|nr:hypothetical protein PUMCH_004322 [[Candida] saopauloensis]
MAEPTPYEHCSHEIVSDFANSGSQILLDAVKTSAESQSFPSQLNSIFTEVLMSVEEESITVDDASEFLKRALLSAELQVIFCQVFDVYPLGENLKSLLQSIADKNLLDQNVLATHISSSTLIDTGLLQGSLFTRQCNTSKRDHFYTQKKFNLFHEEFEGYSLIVSELDEILSNPHNIDLVEYAVEAVNKLIGHYLLDPNRVLDLIIDIFINMLVGNHEFIIQFLKKSLWWPQTEADCLLGFDNLNHGGCTAASNIIILKLKKFPGIELTETFKILVAILIKIGFISFGSIYNRIPPADDTMQLLEKAYLSDLENKVFRASANALALAAPLKDDDDNNTTEGEVKSTQEKNTTEPQTFESLSKLNVKLQLFKVFLANGLYWPSIFMLSQYPFLAHIDKEVASLLNRVLATLISPLYCHMNPLSAHDVSVLQRGRDVSTINRGKLTIGNIPLVTQYCFKPTIKSYYGKRYVYFFKNWADGLPICYSKDDLVTMSHQFLKFFGPILASSHSNFTQICEIIAHDISQDASPENKDMWFNYYRNYIFPYIGWLQDNPVVVDKAYSVLRLFDSEERFNLYGELNQVMARNNSHVKISFGKAEKATKDTLKRLSKENVTEMMKKLASISIYNPLPCYLTILQQLESYENLNSLIVETAAYFSDYCWDNLTLAILMRLSAAGRSSLLENGLNDRRWIQSLASFIGELSQKYPDKIDLDSLIKYLVKSFHAKDISELLVLKEVISKMGGFQAITNLTQLQVNMIRCQSSLANIVYKTIGDSRYEREKSGQILAQTLLTDNYASELFVLICKLDRQIMHDSSSSHLKVLASRRDEVSAILHLLCSLFSFFCEDILSIVSIASLMQKYGVSVSWAFELWRKFLPKEFGLTDIDPTLFDIASVDQSLFYTFWKLDLHDINYSADLYNSELEKLRSNLFQQNEELSFLLNSKGEDASKISPIKDNIKRIEKIMTEIPEQMSTHEKHCLEIFEFLSKDNGSWFTLDQLENNVHDFLRVCLLPRAIHSCFDALYCAQILFKLHELRVPNFSLLSCIEKLFESQILFSTLFTSTPTEAENLGLFVSVILQQLDSWRDEEKFTQLSNQSVISDVHKNEILFASFKKSLFCLHATILSDISRALVSTSYMSRMNVITFLKNLLNIYPIVEDHCEEIAHLIENVSKFDPRDDLKLSSAALIGHVKSREKKWVHMWDFMDMDDQDLEEQKLKRKGIEDDKEAAKKRKQELLLAEARKHAEEQDKLEAEEHSRQISDKNSQASAASLDYSDKVPTGPRNVERLKSTAPRGRYDMYTGSVDTDTATKPSTPTGPQSTRTGSSRDTPPAPSHRATEEKATRPGKQEPDSTDLFAKRISRENTKSPAAPVSRTNTPTNARGQGSRPHQVADVPTSRIVQGRQRASLPPQQAPLEKRAPLPPQQAPLEKRTPLPPQQAPLENRAPSRPQNLLERDSKNAKTSQRGSVPQQRSSDNQLRASLPPQRAPTPHRDSALQQRKPLPPQAPPPQMTQNSRANDRGTGRDSSRDTRDNNRNTYREGARDRGNNYRDNYRDGSRSVSGHDDKRSFGRGSARDSVPRDGANPGGRDRSQTTRTFGQRESNDNRGQNQNSSAGYNAASRAKTRPAHETSRRPPSAGPLPPPSLPPPSNLPPSAKSSDSSQRLNKRLYEEGGESNDKRRRR